MVANKECRKNACFMTIQILHPGQDEIPSNSEFIKRSVFNYSVQYLVSIYLAQSRTIYEQM